MADNKDLTEYESTSLKDGLSELIASSSVFEEFSDVWERMGLSASQLQLRRETIILHINKMLEDFLQQEHELEKSLIASLQTNEVELTSLCEQLKLPMEKLPENMSLCEKERTARMHVDSLVKVKFDRQKRFKRIREMESSLSKEVGEKSRLPEKSHLPSEEELKRYLQGVENLEMTLNERRRKHHDMKEHVQEVSAQLGLELGEEFAVLSDNAKQRKLLYSLDNMKMLKATFQKFEEHVKELEKEAVELRQAVESLWERLEVSTKEQQEVLEEVESFRPRDIRKLKDELHRLEKLKKKHMETFISKTRVELRKIWANCLYGLQQQREFSPAFVDGPFDDDLLSAHESELDRMRGFYQDNLEIFKLLNKREDLFKLYCELECKDSDPMRFSNRGGQLLKDQTAKKLLKKELPRVEKELSTILQQWEDDHERYFIVHDSRYLDAIKTQWSDKEMNKCTEKAKRQKEKEAITMLEMTYGSRSVTPKKRVGKRAAASPATAPSKIRKVEQSPLVRPTTTAGSRLPRSSRARNAKTPVRPIQRRLQDKRKILGGKNSTLAVDESFLSSHNFSLASSAGSYTDFQYGIQSSETQKQIRSSIIQPKENMD